MTELLTTISIIFIIAGPFLLLARLLKLPTAPALIIAGLIAGGFVDETLKLEIARLGIALLVFTFAVRIQTTDVQTAIADSEVIAVGQLCVIGFLGFGAGILLTFPPEYAIYLGIAAAISSSIVGSTLFLPSAEGLIHDRISESIHSIQDFAGLFILLVVSAGVFQLDPIATQLGYGMLLIILAIGINRYAFGIIGKFAKGATEPMLIGTVALLLVFLGIAEFVGLPLVVGAFAAGLAVHPGAMGYAGVVTGLDSLNDFFAAIFFITLGALVSIPGTDVLLMTFVLVVLVGIVKPAVTIALLIYKGYERRTATLTGFNLDQIGEFALIIAIEALFLGMIIPSIFDAIILAAALTMITSSFTRQYDELIYHALADNGLLGSRVGGVDHGSQVPEDITDHVVIIGYGRHGRRLIEACEERDQHYVVVESDPTLREDMKRDCSAYVFGDVIEPSVVSEAKLRSAKLVISTVDSQPISEQLLTITDDTRIILRALNRTRAREYLDDGAYYVSVTDLLAADRLETQLEDLIDGKHDPGKFHEELIELNDPFGGIPHQF